MSFEKIGRIFSLSPYDVLMRLRFRYYRLKGLLFYRWVFKSFGKGSVIYPPMLIGNPKFIRIGKGVVIQEGVRLEAVIVDPANPPAIFIGDGVNIEQNVSISAVGKIYIGNHVGIGARSTIIGSSHPFFDVHDPTKISARIGGVGSVTEIGDYCFMGVNDVIQMNVKLGKYVVVGANTVVKSNVTDYSVVEGNPAAVILTYNKEEDRWVRPAKKS